MIAESYVSRDTARMLKEAGFDEVCRSAYYATGNSAVMYERNSMLSPGYVSRPTQALAARWLRDVHDTPQEAFAHLINKVSKKDVWSENPYVFVYDFELVK